MSYTFLHPIPERQHILPPREFTFPFHYTPHPLCVAAAEKVREYVLSQPQLNDDAKNGKMFGVLVVDTEDGLHFLAAYSALLAGSNKWAWFVPPIYDLQNPDSYFPKEEGEIVTISQHIETLENGEDFHALIAEHAETQAEGQKLITQQKALIKAAKLHRDVLREKGEGNEAAMIKESQQQKADLRRIKQNLDARLAPLAKQIETKRQEISDLKKERSQRSQALQHWLFEQYNVLNAKGQHVPITALFQGIPPSGTGECCAPKLLQCAFEHHWKPVCMAEFWMGKSPAEELRIDGHYYPACRNKCRPILQYMLQGLVVEKNPVLERNRKMVTEMTLLYSDADIAVINKPSGMLAVPGNDEVPSVKDEVQHLFPQATGPLIVHRLDMDTSGIMVLALHFSAYKDLQQQFTVHAIQKRYVALVEGVIEGEGTINLPLCPNPDDRPRQMVSDNYGKEAITHYAAISNDGHITRLNLWPLTGRTHQLRVHCAHPKGLGTAIVGDALYGIKAARLMLHAEEIIFKHPHDGREMHIIAKAPF